MDDELENDGMQQLGAFEAGDARHLLAKLEAAKVAFEIEVDETPLLRPLRGVEVALGLWPPGAKVLIFVAEADLPRAQEMVRES